MRNGSVTDAKPSRSAKWSNNIRLGLITGACSVGASAFAVLATNSDAFVSQAFETAFAAMDVPAVKDDEPRIAKTAFNGVVGSEEFWLRGENAGDLKAIVVGQQIILNANGQARHLMITNVSDAGDAVTHIQTTMKQARVLVLTCREGDAKSGRDVALRLEAGQIAEVPIEAIARVERAL